MLTHSDFQKVHFHTSVGVVALDKNGIIVYGNPQFRSLFSDEAHIEKPASLFLEPADKANNDGGLLPVEGLIDVQYCLNRAKESKTVLISSTRFIRNPGLPFYSQYHQPKEKRASIHLPEFCSRSTCQRQRHRYSTKPNF